MALDTTKSIKKILYNGAEIPMSTSAGYKITFPNEVEWLYTSGTTNYTPSLYLYKADGTTTNISLDNYSKVQGQTIDGVLGLHYTNTSQFHKLRITLDGKVYVTSDSLGVGITSNGTTPATFVSPTFPILFFFLSDSNITKMEVYNVDD